MFLRQAKAGDLIVAPIGDKVVLCFAIEQIDLKHVKVGLWDSEFVAKCVECGYGPREAYRKEVRKLEGTTFKDLEEAYIQLRRYRI